MSEFKTAKITGFYGKKTRLLQKRLSYERLAHTMKSFIIHKYLGAATEQTPSLDDIQDNVFMEVRDRAYDPQPVTINGWMEGFQEQGMDLSRFGVVMPMGETHSFKFHSYSFENDGLGRYIVTGDIIEVPFLEIDGKKALFEVTDVDRKHEPETYAIHVTAIPMRDSQETTDITGYQDQGLLAELQSDLGDEFSQTFTEAGIDTTGLNVSDDSKQDQYDPRPDAGSDFLDNPNATIF